MPDAPVPQAASGFGYFNASGSRGRLLAFFAIAYAGAVVLGFEFRFEPEPIAAFWPAGGLLLGALLVSQTRHWLVVSLVALSSESILALFVYEIPFTLFVQAGLIGTAQALLCAYLLRRLFGVGFALAAMSELTGLGLVALLCTAVGALAGAAVVTGDLLGARYWQAWQIWWLSEFMGLLMISPLIVLFNERTAGWIASLRGRALLEPAVLIGVLMASQLVLGRRSFLQATAADVPYVLFPVLIWAAVRFPPWFAAVSTFVIATLVVWNADLGRGPFISSALSVYQSTLAIQTFMAVTAISVLALCALMVSRSRSEAARRESDARYRTLFQSAGDGVLVIRGSRIVDCNDHFVEMLDATREEVLDKPPWDLSPPTQPDGNDSGPKGRRLLRKLELGEVKLFEWRHQVGDRRPVDCEVSLASAEVVDGEPFVIAHLRDITERKRSQRELNERLKFEQLITELSARFVNLSPDEVDDAVTDGLRSIVEQLDLDRATIFQNGSGSLELTHSWAKDGVPSHPTSDQLSLLAETMQQGKTLLLPDLDQLPPEASADAEVLRDQGQRALVVFPLQVGSALIGGASFGAFRRRRELSDEQVQRLRLGAEVFSNALERKRADEALRESEERFREVFESSPTGMMIRRLDDLSPVAANDAVAEIFGYDREQFLKLRLEDIFDPGSAFRHEEMATAVRGGEAWHFDSMSAFREDGEKVACQGFFVPLSYRGERHVLGIVRNVTDEHRARRALLESRERFAKAFDASPDSLAIVSFETGRILEVNRGFIAASGYSREEVIGRTSLELGLWFDPADRQRLLGQLAQKKEVRSSARVRVKSGEVRLTNLSAIHLDLPGEPRFLVVLRDVTEQEQARAALKESEEKFFKAFHASPVAAVITGLEDSRIRELNDAAVRTFGYSRQEVIGRTTAEVAGWVDPKDRERVVATLRAGGTIDAISTRFRRRDGVEIDAEYSAVIIEVGGEPHLYSTAVDVTESKRAAARRARALEEIARLKTELERERDYLREEVKTARHFGEIVGESPPVAEMLGRIDAVAGTDATVLIQGESGVGKELVATAIHAQSSRSEGPLVRVNCASVPQELFESEFFGHVKGAFTGAARDRVGRFQLAHRGTLFLDEVSEIPMELQPKLLRALQEGEVQRVGETESRHIDVRVIAATNRDLREDILQARFRIDLYYRLNVFPIQVPPLRERGHDIVLLAQHFTEEICRQMGREPLAFSRYQAEKLLQYGWPGNVRELRNAIEKGVILSSGPRLHFELAGLDPAQSSIRETVAEPEDESPDFLSYSELERRERENLIAALEAANWKVSGPGGAAELLGVKPTTLSSKMKAMAVERPR